MTGSSTPLLCVSISVAPLLVSNAMKKSKIAAPMLGQHEILVPSRLRFPGPSHGNGTITNLAAAVGYQVFVSPPRSRVNRVEHDLTVHLVAIDIAHPLDLSQLHAVHIHCHRLL